MSTPIARHLIKPLFAMLAACALFAFTAPASAQSGNVGVSITVDQDSVEIIKAWRRQQGIDPPNAAADRRVSQILQARRAAQAESQRMALAASACGIAAPANAEAAASAGNARSSAGCSSAWASRSP
jgi:hypothetical protein